MFGQKEIRYFIYFVFTYGWLSANIPMTVLPPLVKIFHTTPTMIKLSVTSFLASFAATQVVWGPLSDRFGRKPVLIVGACITVFGAILAAISRDVGFFISARFIEAVGMGAGPVIARSIITDKFEKTEVTNTIAMSAVIVGIMPSLAPILGNWLDLILGWRSIFCFLALYGLLLIYFTKSKLPETHPNINRQLTFKHVVSSYKECLHHRPYFGSLLLYGLFYGLQLGYYTAAPFIFIVNLGYSPEVYGWFMLFTVLSYILGAYVSKHLARAISLKWIVVISIFFNAFGLLLLSLFYFLLPMTGIIVIIPMVIVIMGSGMISPAVNTISMLSFKENRGAASALLGCSMVGFSAIFSALMAVFSNETLLPLIGMLAFILLSALIIYWAALKDFFLRSQI